MPWERPKEIAKDKKKKKKDKSKDRIKMAEKKDWSAPSLIKATKLQPTAEQPSTKYTTNYQKIYPTSECKEEATSRC